MADLLDPKPVYDDTYHPQDALAKTVHAITYTGAAGLFLAAVQNTVAKENVGAFGVFSRFGKTIGLFAAMGGTFSFVSTASANLREKNDFVNHAIGGACAGSLVGLANRLAYKDEAKTRYRRPINETINELGEGRGIYGPGYEERRKQRIKERYGIEIQEPYYKNKPAEGMAKF
ncbi:hypothetical protein LTR40_001931 [Exophiala xenobiotica]|nr:hypothetical protein LTR40_001931 [Exophiala xenobiotica]